MKKSYIKESFDRYIDLLVKKSFGVHQINEMDFSGGRNMPSTFKGDAMSGEGGRTFSTFKGGDDPMSGSKKRGFSDKYSMLYSGLKDKMDDFSSYMIDYKMESESRKNIDSFLHMLKGMDDVRMRKNIEILADAMISAQPNTNAKRDFERKYKQKGITTKEQLVQAIYKEVMDRKNYRPDPNM